MVSSGAIPAIAVTRLQRGHQRTDGGVAVRAHLIPAVRKAKGWEWVIDPWNEPQNEVERLRPRLLTAK